MEIKSVYDKEFAPYGQVHQSFDPNGLLAHLGSNEAGQGACADLSSENIDIEVW